MSKINAEIHSISLRFKFLKDQSNANAFALKLLTASIVCLYGL